MSNSRFSLLVTANGCVEIDQNLCENAMRRLALGRKNWLHIGSQEAGPKIAAIRGAKVASTPVLIGGFVCAAAAPDASPRPRRG